MEKQAAATDNLLPDLISTVKSSFSVFEVLSISSTHDPCLSLSNNFISYHNLSAISTAIANYLSGSEKLYYALALQDVL